jgi:hypothetical protein
MLRYVVPFFLFASPAYAGAVSDAATAEEFPFLRMGISLLGLLVAMFLLFEAGRVKEIAQGGAIVEKINFVVLAILCLAAAALVRWVQNFVADVTLAQVQLASEALVIVAMALLALYFASVRKALRDFLVAMTGSQSLATEIRSEDNAGDEDADRG